jgi:hypothetical protein
MNPSVEGIPDKVYDLKTFGIARQPYSARDSVFRVAKGYSEPAR